MVFESATSRSPRQHTRAECSVETSRSDVPRTVVRIAIRVSLALAISAVLAFTPGKATVRAATIIIAASDSSSQWKSQATAVCDGIADQVEINAYLKTGNVVQLAPGNFWINSWIFPQGGSRLTGQGNATVINLNNTSILVTTSVYPNVNNIELDNFKLAGTTNQGGAIMISAINAAASGFYVHDIWATTKGTTDFLVYANTNSKISNIAFVRDYADSPDGFGFAITGEGTNPRVEDVTYYRCSVYNAGVAPTRLVASDGISWVTGFDLAEYHGLTVNRLQVIKCSVNGAWESDFHSELAPTKTNFVIMDSTASNAGLKTGGALFGAGYLVPFLSGRDDIVLSNNAAYNNMITPVSGGMIADQLVWDSNAGRYGVYSPTRDLVFPSGSAKVSSRVSQGNCTGLAVDNGVYKDLFLYSNDGNPVNQQIDLGAVYAANDGKTYSFSGTSIVAQFTDYAVVRLVKSATTQPPSSGPLAILTASLPDGTVGAAYYQTLAATGGTAPYTWTVAGGVLPAGLSLSSGGVISGTPTVAGGPNYIDFKVTDGTGASILKTLTMTVQASTIPPASSGPVAISTASLPNAMAGAAYSQTMSASGGTAPYRWGIAAGALPAGLSLSLGGAITGTPVSAGGPTQVTFQVTDSASATVTKSISITVAFAAWDVNMDGAVNLLDIILTGQHLGETGAPGWIRADVNSDGVVSVLDAILVGQHLN